MPSPPRPPRGSPPRRALHERTDSQTNEGSPSTLRMVREPPAPIHETDPYPTKPSQVLSPSGQYPVLEQKQRDFPYEQEPTMPSPFRDQKDRSASPAYDKRRFSRQGSDGGPLLEISSAEISSYTASGMSSTPNLMASEERSESDITRNRVRGFIRKVSDEDLRGSSYPEASRLWDDPAGVVEDTPKSERQPASKDSENSLSSTNSTGTVIVKRVRDGKKRASYSAFPYTSRPNSSRSNISSPVSQKAVASGPGEEADMALPVSAGSPVSPLFPPSSGPQISSESEPHSPNNIQYPIIKPPSATGSWAESSLTPSRQPPRALERAQGRWNPHLSTVQSEGSPSSASGERSSQSMWIPDSSRASKSSSNVYSPRMSSVPPPVRRKDSFDYAASAPSKPILSPRPGPPPDLLMSPPVRQRDITGSTIRVVDTHEKETLRLPPTIPGSRDSELEASGTVDGRRSGVVMRPGSRASFFRDSIPAWAKAYYARSSSSSSMPKNDPDRRISTSTDNISLNIFRPRNRAQKPNFTFNRRTSGLNMHPLRPQELNPAEISGPSGGRVSPTWSPHLWHDRTPLGRRRRLFQPPSIDEQVEGRALTKRNLQIALFAFGFIFPPAWFIAAVLPLPPRPMIPAVKGKNAVRQTQIVQDLEKQFRPVDEARYENVRYWRYINRILCLVGAAVTVTVVSSGSS